MNKPTHKNCCVRLPADLHRRAKLLAYQKGLTLQELVTLLIESALSRERNDQTKTVS